MSEPAEPTVVDVGDVALVRSSDRDTGFSNCVRTSYPAACRSLMVAAADSEPASGMTGSSARATGPERPAQARSARLPLRSLPASASALPQSSRVRESRPRH